MKLLQNKWSIKRKWWLAKRKWRRFKRKWRANPDKGKIIAVIGVGLMFLGLAGWQIVRHVESARPVKPQTVMEELVEELKEGDLDSLSTMLREDLGSPDTDLPKPAPPITGSGSPGASRPETTPAEETSPFPPSPFPFSVPGDETTVTNRTVAPGQPGTGNRRPLLERLRDDYPKIKKLVRTGETYITTFDEGEYMVGAVLVNSPEGFYHIRVKLKRVDGKWVIVK